MGEVTEKYSYPGLHLDLESLASDVLGRITEEDAGKKMEMLKLAGIPYVSIGGTIIFPNPDSSHDRRVDKLRGVVADVSLEKKIPVITVFTLDSKGHAIEHIIELTDGLKDEICSLMGW